jgi:hypothetical protein
VKCGPNGEPKQRLSDRKKYDHRYIGGIRGCNMSQFNNKRMLRLLQISIDLGDQMAEVHKLRNSLQLAVNERRGKWPDAGVVNDHEPQSNEIGLR